MISWYVVYTKPKVRQRQLAILVSCFSVYLPQHHKLRRHAGKRENKITTISEISFRCSRYDEGQVACN